MTDREIRMEQAYSTLMDECRHHLIGGMGCTGCVLAEKDTFGGHRCRLLHPVIRWERLENTDDEARDYRHSEP